jgi:5-methyltetrahydrofolate--homocysteine methyltransferase
MLEAHGLSQAIENGRRTEAVKLTRVSLERGESPHEILNALLSGMEVIGRQFKANEIFMPEVLIASMAMRESMNALQPHLEAAGIEPDFTAVIGAVRHDLHDIGKNLVAMMWRGAHIRVIDVGTNAAADKFIEAAIANNATVIGLSSLLTTTMLEMEHTVDEIHRSGIPAKVIVGGAPVSSKFASAIGADGFARDAASAVDEARRLAA